MGICHVLHGCGVKWGGPERPNPLYFLEVRAAAGGSDAGIEVLSTVVEELLLELEVGDTKENSFTNAEPVQSDVAGEESVQTIIC